MPAEFTAPLPPSTSARRPTAATPTATPPATFHFHPAAFTRHRIYTDKRTKIKLALSF